MDFASSHVYAYDLSDEECVSEEELEQGMEASDSDSDGNECDRMLSLAAPAAPPAPPPAPKAKSGGFLGSLFGGRGGGAGGSRTRSAPTPKKAKKKSHWRVLETSDGPPPPLPVRGKRYRRADTNVVSVKFSQLIAPSNMHTGDATYCTQCNAVLSHLSKITKEEDQQVWKCEFCGVGNPVDLFTEELPQNDDVTFMLQPAPCTTASGKSGLDQSLVIFCVDTSGSMCVTTEVPGKVRLRGSERLDSLQSLNDTHEDQFMPGQRRNVTYVSRLQGVQAAVDHQLEEMTRDAPNRRVALITFSNDVLVVGDGSQEPVTVAGDKLKDQEKLAQIGAEIALPKTVNESRKALGDKVFDLEERGGTALGPALVVAVSMACQVPGSKVIICTDGMANVGLGSLEDIEANDEKRTNAENFYTAVSSMAVDKGVAVSVISIKGTDCKMVELGKVADVTGGQVNIVDPLKLTQEFGTILSDPIIATNVKATLITHAGLYIRDEENEADQSQSRAVRMVGNVSKATEVTFEFGVKKKQDQQQQAGAEAGTSNEAAAGSSSQQQPQATGGETPSDMPFQVQITYTDLDGAQALRLLTKAKPVTRDRAVAEKQINLGVLGVNAAQKSAALAMKGHYTASRLNSHMQQRLVSRWTRQTEPEQRHKYVNFVSNIAPMANMLNQQQQVEISRTGTTYSDDEDSGDEEGMGDLPTAVLGAPPPPPPAPGASGSASAMASDGSKLKKLRKKFTKSKVYRERKAECDDESAKVLYQMKQAKSSAFM